MFAVDVRPGAPGCVLGLRGELDFESAVQLREAADALLGDRPALVVVDCAALTFCDSSGIGAFVGIYQRLSAHQGVLRLAGAPGSVARVFSLTGLDRAIALYATVADALGAAGSGGGQDSSAEGMTAPAHAGEREVAGS